jgi:peptidylprolyl isomerase
VTRYSRELLADTYVSFIILTSDSLWLIDGKHVVFGKVVEGMGVVRAIEQVGSDSGRTRVDVVIADSGQLR